nr:hypothetical protein [Streptomyces sp. S1D4-11]
MPAGLRRDTMADQALADAVRAEAGAGMSEEEWDLTRVTPL